MDIGLNYYPALSGRILDLSYLYTRGVAIGLKYAALTGQTIRVCLNFTCKTNYSRFSVKIGSWFCDNKEISEKKTSKKRFEYFMSNINHRTCSNLAYRKISVKFENWF